MKNLIVLLGLIFLFGEVSKGQERDDFFFHEFQVSLNRTTIENSNTEDRFGFGLGAYHTFMAEKKISLVFGLEFNRTRQFRKSMYQGHFANATDLTYTLNYISIPIGIKANVGSKTKVFVEAGGFADLLINAHRTGTMHTYLPDENNQMSYRKTDIDEKVRLSNGIGLYLGIGIRIPVSKFELVIKPDYKFGINKLYSYQDDIYNRYFRLNVGVKVK